VTDQAGQQSQDAPQATGSGGAPASGAGGSDDKNLGRRILQSIENLVTLNIETIVNDGDIAKKMSSTINLIDGDITTEFDIAFVTGDLKELRDYHTQREGQGHQIIKDNIEALEHLIQLFTNAKSSIDSVQPPTA
jgi:hypothetical protein